MLCYGEKLTINWVLMSVMLRPTAGLAMATARTTGSLTSPPGFPIACAIGVIPTKPIIEKNVIPSADMACSSQDRRRGDVW